HVGYNSYCNNIFRLNDFLDNLNMGERTIKGCLEAYSCKHAGTDKKLSISLETEILDYLGQSSDTDSSSPDQTLLTRTSRKTLVYLVLTLYHIYPDYDFSAVKAHQFFAEESWDSFKQIFDTYMCEASKVLLLIVGGTSLMDTLFKALMQVVKLADCEIYGYVPDSEADPLQESGAIWSFNFLFYNRKLKRIVTFRFSCFRSVGNFTICSESIWLHLHLFQPQFLLWQYLIAGRMLLMKTQRVREEILRLDIMSNFYLFS
ncbi:repressor of RNA polymerase III transcription MAF1 homolog, partial [Vigna umbellata]|uniref:repressor of RNA polymerase III transcription MAF1 homolog n=1 Tax=Vigna umbellata TaxID=87088 RepID=UPI001F5E70E8